MNEDVLLVIMFGIFMGCLTVAIIVDKVIQYLKWKNGGKGV